VNRAVWIARIVAVIMLLLFAILFANLHSKLRQLQDQKAQRPAATTSR
jgi:hypothetical protein